MYIGKVKKDLHLIGFILANTDSLIFNATGSAEILILRTSLGCWHVQVLSGQLWEEDMATFVDEVKVMRSTVNSSSLYEERRTKNEKLTFPV